MQRGIGDKDCWFEEGLQDQAESIVALDDINIAINDGELVTLASSSGSGKTTLLNLLGTLDSITEGDIEFNGAHLGKMNGGVAGDAGTMYLKGGKVEITNPSSWHTHSDR